MSVAAEIARVLVVVLGPAMGSAAALLADRLPRGDPVGLTRSRCRSCGRVLGARELVPVLSWLWQRGRCAGCGAAIPAWLLQAEIAGLALGIGAALVGAGAGQVLLGALVLWCLLALTLADLRHFRLPDALTAALLVLAIGLAVIGDGRHWPGWPERLAGALAGAALVAGAFAALRAAYRWRSGREGLGAGDVKLMAGIGALTGPGALAVVTLVAGVSALAVAGWRARARGRRLRRDARLPFGAFLAMAAALVWLLTGAPAPFLALR